MNTLLDRLRRALEPRYEVEGVLARGGMAVVFEARDPALDRPVAIKVLRPEQATARGAARFLKEARAIARLGHPNVVAVHEAGEADGLFYLVMDRVEGPTLAERLAEGPLDPEAAASVGLDLLSALDAAHERGIVHRDVKPGNVFLLPERALLADFGIAKLDTTAEEGLTVPGGRVGTPGYMAPEQALGERVTPRSDLYAVGAVLYEALTGHRWSSLDDPENADWSGVPGPLARALRRALARSPDHRWPDAASFRNALAGTRSRRSRLAVAAGAAGLAAVAVAVVLVVGRDDGAAGPAPAELAILPCQFVAPEDSALAEEIARAAHYHLEGVLRMPPHQQVFRWAKRAGGSSEGAAAALHTKHVVDCRLVRDEGDRLRLLLDIDDARGRTVFRDELVGTGRELGERLARSALAALHPRARDLAAWLEGYSLTAVKEFFDGEAAWEIDARRAAAAHFARAARIDSAFALARWRLADVRRWIPVPPGEDLEALHARYADELPPTDRRLLEAKITPPGPRQFALYERILEERPLDAYATLHYGDELLHRGPLWGVPPDSALRVLELAARVDSFLAPALDHLAQAQIRLGRTEAEATLARLLRIYAGPEEDPFPLLWRAAYRERFGPERPEEALRALFQGPQGEGLLPLAARYPMALHLPSTQVTLARLLIERSPAGLPQRTSGHVGAGIALMAMGRPIDALAEFDAAARNQGSAEARLQAAQWRVVSAALEVPGLPAWEVLGSRSALLTVAGDTSEAPVRRAHAAWSAALLARKLSDGDVELARARRLAEAAAEDELLRFADGLAAARQGNFRRALDLTAPLLDYDSARRVTRPFLRAGVQWVRGEWFEALARPDSALASWAWHEHMDLGGVWSLEVSDEWSPLPRAGEVDWAVGTWARLRRARLLLPLGRDAEACPLLAEVLRLWEDPGPGVDVEARDARRLARERCADP